MLLRLVGLAPWNHSTRCDTILCHHTGARNGVAGLPRGRMVCASRPLRVLPASKRQLVMMAALESMTVAQLREKLLSLGLPCLNRKP